MVLHNPKSRDRMEEHHSRSSDTTEMRGVEMGEDAVLTVRMLRPCSMYTTSSVATFPLAPGAYGHPPNPATELSTTPTPILTKQANETLSKKHYGCAGCTIKETITNFAQKSNVDQWTSLPRQCLPRIGQSLLLISSIDDHSPRCQ